MTARKILKTKSDFPDFSKMVYEEEADWWENHDLSAVWDKLDDVDLTIETGALHVPAKLRKLSSLVNVRLDPVDHQKLRIVASRKGLGIGSLVRMWVLERLQEAGSLRGFSDMKRAPHSNGK